MAMKLFSRKVTRNGLIRKMLVPWNQATIALPGFSPELSRVLGGILNEPKFKGKRMGLQAATVIGFEWRNSFGEPIQVKDV